ncbi:MAG: aminotransferase class V-fold PLP-dependent enzyme [Xanthomonadales bacterium]|nr:aminotransferase class V-fold PLP-dependent enzyme [Xanthomonadales bacterium]
MDRTELDAYLDQQFPTRREMLYANHAAISPWPRAARDAVEGFARENVERGPMGVSQWLLRESRLRRTVAGFLNTDEDDVAFLQNTSEGINLVAAGIDWQAGDNVVTACGEYVSNRLPWLALAGRGVEIREVDIRATADPEAALLNAMDARSRVLTVSSVQWNDGLRLDLERLGKTCKDSDALFFVDAIQQFCALQLDVRACHIDALSAGSHKWQMGPEGIGVFYASPAARDTLQLHRHGWRMLEQPYQFDHRSLDAAQSARRFEIGSPNTLGQAALAGALSVFEKLGIETTESSVLANTDQLSSGLSSIPGVRLHSPHESRRRSGIVAFSSGSATPAQLRSRLSRKGLFAAVRGDALRLSPHFYQAGENIEKMLGVIEDCI